MFTCIICVLFSMPNWCEKWLDAESSCTCSRDDAHWIKEAIMSPQYFTARSFRLLILLNWCQVFAKRILGHDQPTNQVAIVYKPNHWRGTKTISGRIRRRKIPKISFSRFFFGSIKKVRCCTETFSRKFVSRKKNRSSSLSRRFFRFRERAMPAAATEFFVVGCNYRKKLNDVTLFSLKGEKPPTRKLENIGVATLARTATDLARFFLKTPPKLCLLRPKLHG